MDKNRPNGRFIGRLVYLCCTEGRTAFQKYTHKYERSIQGAENQAGHLWIKPAYMVFLMIHNMKTVFYNMGASFFRKTIV